MYRAYCDGVLFFQNGDATLALNSAKVTLEKNAAGTFDFAMPPSNPYADAIRTRASAIEVYNDNRLIFAGFPVASETDFYNQRTVACNGELAYLEDTIQRQGEYHNVTVRRMLETFIAAHNSQSDQKFEVGNVTVTDSNDSLFRYTNYENTWEAIGDKLIDRLGGFVTVRREGGKRYVDYLAQYLPSGGQVIRFGENLLDLVQNRTTAEIATVCIPLGSEMETAAGSPEGKPAPRVTIAPVNGGRDYIQSDEAVRRYGRITRAVTWDDVTVPANLLRKGREWLASSQYEKLTLDVGAVDLHFISGANEPLEFLHTVRAVSASHGMDAEFPITKVEIDLQDPSRDAYQLGDGGEYTLTSMVKSAAAGADGKIAMSQTSAVKRENRNAARVEQSVSALDGRVVGAEDGLKALEERVAALEGKA